MKTLSAKQMKVLGSLSWRAYRLLASRGHVQELYDDWRHSYTEDVTGCTSWRALSQRQYIPLVNALRGICGLPAVDDNTPQDKAASLAWTVQDRSAFWELPLAYVAAIVADKFKRPDATSARSWSELLTPLDAGQMKQLVYTIEARGRRREQKAAEKLGLPAPAEVHISRSTMPPQRLADWRGDVLATPTPAAKPKRKGRKHAPVCQP